MAPAPGDPSPFYFGTEETSENEWFNPATCSIANITSSQPMLLCAVDGMTDFQTCPASAFADGAPNAGVDGVAIGVAVEDGCQALTFNVLCTS